MAYKEGTWFKKNGYNEKGFTYVYFPKDSFDVKDELKEAGFRFDKTLLWHAPEIPAGYEDKVVEIWFQAIGTMSTWFEGFYTPAAKDIVMKRLIEARPEEDRPQPTEWYGEEKDKVNLHVTVVFKKSMTTAYGPTNLIKFKDDEGHLFQWWSASALAEDLEEGQELQLAGTIKSHDEYLGTKYTTLTRCKAV